MRVEPDLDVLEWEIESRSVHRLPQGLDPSRRPAICAEAGPDAVLGFKPFSTPATSAMVGNMPMFNVGVPNTTALASRTSRMTTLRGVALALQILTGTPPAVIPSAMANAIFSVLPHMESKTSSALCSV